MREPIEAGDVIRRVFRIYVDQAPVLMPAAAVVFVITGIVTQLLVAKGSEGLALLAEVIDLVASTLFTGMVVELVADVRDGRRDASPRQLLRAVTPVLGQLLAVAIVSSIVEAIGFLLIIVPGLFLVTIWAVVAPVVVIERPGGLRALPRSRELVRGNGWQVFGVVLVLVIGVAILVAAVAALSGEGGTVVGIVVRVVVGVLSAPISALGAAVLYFELRGRERGGGHLQQERTSTFPG
ncbi:MAG: YciC family protein [Solirubrobacteraceae bacterium]